MADTGERIVGVLGGMGPLAGAWFMQRLVVLTPPREERAHVPAILINDPRVPDRVAPLLEGRGENPLPAMVQGVRRLEAAGAGLVAIPCNTAHGWHAEIAAATSLPVLNMVEIAAQAPLESPVGLLATRGTIQAGFYQSALAARGLRVLLAPEQINDDHVLPAIAAVKVGDMATAQEESRAAERALKAQGARSILLACSELSVCWPEDLRAGTLDACDALARAALRWAGVEA
ncbi:MAG: amino acid racemase [Pseudomonadota bacterium]